jgi:hypothetical protein
MAEVFKEVLKIIVTLKTVTVFKKVITVVNISYYLHNRRSDIFITN